MNCIKKIQIDDTVYEANVYFKNIIRCDEISRDKTIGGTERVLGIICTVFGDKGLDNPNHYEKLINWVQKYALNGEEKKDEIPDMDYKEDYDLIWTSFKSDYQGMDIDKEELDWHRFCNMMNGLSNSELGNCCALNRVRNLRNFDLSKIQDDKERNRIAKLKEEVALKKYKKENNLTEEQERSMEELNKILGL